MSVHTDTPWGSNPMSSIPRIVRHRGNSSHRCTQLVRRRHNARSINTIFRASPQWSRHHMDLDPPSSLQYKQHLGRQFNCRSLKCSWSIVCRRCPNHIFILDLTLGFKWLAKDDFKTRWESFKYCDLVRLIWKNTRYAQKTPRYLTYGRSVVSTCESDRTIAAPHCIYNISVGSVARHHILHFTSIELITVMSK